MSADFLTTPLQFIKGVGPRRAADLSRVGLLTVEDLLFRFPLRYEDRARVATIGQLKPGDVATVIAVVKTAGVRQTRRPGFRLFEAIVEDHTGVIRAVFPNQAFLRDVFHPGQHVVLFGSVEYRSGLQLTNPEYELLKSQGAQGADGEDEDEETVHTGRIVPIYEKAGSMTGRLQRSLVHRLIADLPADVADPIPADIRARLHLPDRRRAIVDAHFPAAGTDLDELARCRTPAQRRLIFEEFLLFQAGLLLRQRGRAGERKRRPVKVDDRIRDAARAVLPFKLTGGQREALRQIVLDMQRETPMNRLLQGDVGAGKTMVALLAALVAMENGLQVAFMAPTEILADQHYLTIRRLLDRSRFRIASLTAGAPAARRREVLAELAAGSVHLVVGTHALVEQAVSFHDLGLIVIDEQHRFGVMQRATLRAKGEQPDVLVMTATPIPRTLALTAYGDLDVSVIRDRPPGRGADRDDREARVAPRRGVPDRGACARRRAADLRDLSTRRGVGESRSARRDGHGRPPPGGGVSGVQGRAPARPAQAGREGSGDGRLRARRRLGAGRHDGRGSGHRRRERDRDDCRARGAVRACHNCTS